MEHNRYIPSTTQFENALERTRKICASNPNCDYHTVSNTWQGDLCFVCAEGRCEGPYAGTPQRMPVCAACVDLH